eukprot:m.268780 g.268780  ORF g.268780 m.268780 type:complete len:573 (+) comp17656_c0_seq5:211-1929(+)
MAARLLVLFLGLAVPSMGMYDVLVDYYDPPSSCADGCALWSDLASDNCTRSQSDVNAKWKSGQPPSNAARLCGMPANDPGFDGAWCYCKNSHSDTWDYCQPKAKPVPEQINLQVAGPDTVTVGFVSFEPVANTHPKAMLSTTPDMSDAIEVSGTSQLYVETSNETRHYAMCYVVFNQLKPLTTYYYKVTSGSDNNVWSAVYNFRSLYNSNERNETKFAIFGDMGVYTYNNMDWLQLDAQNNAIDFIVHLGDHAYDLPEDSGRRGDGYFAAFQPVLSSVPWVPILGNHEYHEGDDFNRFLNQTYGVTLASVPTPHPHSHINTFLAMGSAIGQEKRTSGVPSHTSRYYSVDVGQVHVIALDLNVYYFDTELAFRKPMIDWLAKDLAAAQANRHNVPWITVNAHQPIYCSSITLPGEAPTLWEYWYDISQGENPGTFEGCTGTGVIGVEVSRKDLEPLFKNYSVDAFFAGHEHDYESIYAVMDGKVINKCDEAVTAPGKCTFTNPQGVVQFVTGAGGAPALDKFGDPGPFTRLQLSAWGYGRVTANATTFMYEHVLNSNGTVFDKVVIRKDPAAV